MDITWNGNGRDDEIEVDAGGWYVTFKTGETKDVPDELVDGLLARADFSTARKSKKDG